MPGPPRGKIIVPLLTKSEFLANLEKLRGARFCAAAGSPHSFYDAQFLGWLDEALDPQGWVPMSAFQSVARKVLTGPLDIESLQRFVASSLIHPEIAARQLGHRFHGLMSAFSPSSCFADPSREVKDADELIRSSEGDHFRCKPFIEFDFYAGSRRSRLFKSESAMFA